MHASLSFKAGRAPGPTESVGSGPFVGVHRASGQPPGSFCSGSQLLLVGSGEQAKPQGKQEVEAGRGGCNEVGTTSSLPAAARAVFLVFGGASRRGPSPLYYVTATSRTEGLSKEAPSLFLPHPQPQVLAGPGSRGAPALASPTPSPEGPSV